MPSEARAGQPQTGVNSAMSAPVPHGLVPETAMSETKRRRGTGSSSGALASSSRR